MLCFSEKKRGQEQKADISSSQPICVRVDLGVQKDLSFIQTTFHHHEIILNASFVRSLRIIICLFVDFI